MIKVYHLVLENLWTAECECVDGLTISFSTIDSPREALEGLIKFRKERNARIAEERRLAAAKRAAEERRLRERAELAARCSTLEHIGNELTRIDRDLQSAGYRQLTAMITHLATVRREVQIELNRSQAKFRDG